MKLREKFKTEFSINTSGESGRFADKCEKIADNHAYNFAEWLMDRHYLVKDNSLWRWHGEEYTTKELLETYKKEKNL
jgi:hypothetical protein